MKKIVESILDRYDRKIVEKSGFEELEKKAGHLQMQNLKLSQSLELLKVVAPEFRSSCVELLDKSKAQLKQDLFVLSELGFKKNGFFVEFGATNGVDLSNSHLLEKEFQWGGILAEPAKNWHHDLKKNRSVPIETRCVWSRSGETLKFNEADCGEFSTIDAFSDKDLHSGLRESGTKYDVETISLLDLLDAHGAPDVIDYLSIDTEGSELEILEAFDFDRYQFNVITCEHNHTPLRKDIYELLTSKGYKRKHEHLSRFDDWYIFSTS